MCLLCYRGLVALETAIENSTVVIGYNEELNDQGYTIKVNSVTATESDPAALEHSFLELDKFFHLSFLNSLQKIYFI